MSAGDVPAIVRALWLAPKPLLQSRLREAVRAGLVKDAPTEWQLFLGVIRMWHRLLFRSETVGLSNTSPVRETVWAKVLQFRPVRFAFLMEARAVAPMDTTGLASDRERVIAHLLGAHHDGEQFVYDCELLQCHPEGLRVALEAARSVVEGTHPRARWLRELVVYEGYHESLVQTLERANRGEISVESARRDDPDLTLSAYLRWCLAQPASWQETKRAWRSGSWALIDQPWAITARPEATV
ncbi:MAG: hypothetical protein Q8Q09_26125 [Deltaproteobacteria bacterium]|nr:hypothetical protein [Deltaproteobacteria bacterium]